MKLLFAGADDIHDPRGRIAFGANSLRCVGEVSGLMPLRPRCAVARQDGGCDLYGTSIEKGTPRRIMRGRTYDGVHFEGAEVVMEERSAIPWMGEADIACNAAEGRFLALMFARGEKWWAPYAFGSDDGRAWRRLSDKPVYQDHDALGLTWDPQTKEFVCCQTTYQPYQKLYPDNTKASVRRVIHILRSKDGIEWNHPTSVALPDGPFVPDGRLITPDADDPPDMEFYRLTAFPYGDRYAGMMLNYAASPDIVNPNFPRTTHGPQLSGEWWVSADGSRWSRPWRDVFAPGEAEGAITHEPMTLNGWHLWLIGRRTFGLPQDHVFFAGSLANAEFSTRLFTMPQDLLMLRAGSCFHGSVPRGFKGQAYLMVELRDAENRVIAGFEKERCIVRPSEDTPMMLSWGGRPTFDLKGREARLRFYLRDARVYSVSG